MSAPASIGEVGSDAGHLYHLLDAMVDMVLDNGTAANGQGEWPRLSAMLWVARDLAEKVERDIEACSNAARGAA